jgi:hypothetical protein
MPRFDVMYKVYDNANKNTFTGPSHYNMVVEAMHQGEAEQMVKNMNGADRTDILRCMHLGN